MSELDADTLQNDREIQKAIEQILERVATHTAKITELRPPQAEHVQSYEETLKAYSYYRGANLFYPYLGSGIGNGALVELGDGSVKYDFISGIGVHFGHSHPTLIEASLRASLEDIAMQGNLQQNLSSHRLMEMLVQASELPHCFLTTSGAMANENALKLAFQKNAPAERILAFDGCFMGRTLTLSQITDRPLFREGLPHTVHVDYLPFYNWRDPQESTKQTLATLEKYLERYPDKYACICFEMIQGDGGCYPGKQEFFTSIMKRVKEQNIAVIVDEVQTFGRTEKLFAFQSFGVQEYVDIVTVGKLLHLCATLYTTPFRPKPGLLSQTYTAASSSIYIAQAIVHSLLNDGYVGHAGKNMQIRKRFVEHLTRIAGKYPDHFEGPFGYGLMIGATPFKGEKQKVFHYLHALFEAGVIAFTSGLRPSRIRFLLPAGGITMEAIDHVGEILEEVLVKCLKH